MWVCYHIFFDAIHCDPFTLNIFVNSKRVITAITEELSFFDTIHCDLAFLVATVETTEKNLHRKLAKPSRCHNTYTYPKNGVHNGSNSQQIIART